MKKIVKKQKGRIGMAPIWFYPEKNYVESRWRFLEIRLNFNLFLTPVAIFMRSVFDPEYEATIPIKLQPHFYWEVDRVNLPTSEEQIDTLAKVVREAWAEYAKETLGDKCPAGFTKSWEDTGDWGREGNRVVARAAISHMLGAEEENEGS